MQQFSKSEFVWLIEVVWPPESEGRLARYFDGSCEAHWLGNTTSDADRAARYASKREAEVDIRKLTPRVFGSWEPRQHGFIS